MRKNVFLMLSRSVRDMKHTAQILNVREKIWPNCESLTSRLSRLFPEKAGVDDRNNLWWGKKSFDLSKCRRARKVCKNKREISKNEPHTVREKDRFVEPSYRSIHRASEQQDIETTYRWITCKIAKKGYKQKQKKSTSITRHYNSCSVWFSTGTTRQNPIWNGESSI